MGEGAADGGGVVDRLDVGKGGARGGIADDDIVAQTLDEWARDGRGNGCDPVDPIGGEPGCEDGHGQEPAFEVSGPGVAVDHGAVSEDVAAADLDLAAGTW
jgi:hypothetical protein